MKREIRNLAASVRQRLRNLSRERGEDFNLTLTQYGLERLLYRLGKSEYADRFILKGAMLFVLWEGDAYRPTRDLDLLGYGDLDQQSITDVFRDICSVEVEPDGVMFNADSIIVAEIREAQEYGGYRVTLTGELDNARIDVQVDVGIGDQVTPEAVSTRYPSLLDMPEPEIRVYPPESVIAEKLQAIVALGMTNSRMKDFYDIWRLSTTHNFGSS